MKVFYFTPATSHSHGKQYVVFHLFTLQSDFNSIILRWYASFIYFGKWRETGRQDRSNDNGLTFVSNREK